MSDDDNTLAESEDFESWYDGEVVGIEFIADGITALDARGAAVFR